ncbi:MAG: NAD-dependent epimerase/dehydratase family protein, partial [Bdellovibrionota bacterium]
MRVLISGITGFVGTRLAHVLISKGYEVRGLSRNPAKPTPRLPSSCKLFYWNPEDLTSAIDPASLENIDALIHLAGESITAKRWNAVEKKRILDSRIRGTRVLVENIRTRCDNLKI